MIEILAKLNWASIIQDVITVLFKRNEESVVALLTNVFNQIAANMEVAAVPEVVTEEVLDENFINMLKLSTPVENNRIRFTSEGGFVMEETT